MNPVGRKSNQKLLVEEIELFKEIIEFHKALTKKKEEGSDTELAV